MVDYGASRVRCGGGDDHDGVWPEGNPSHGQCLICTLRHEIIELKAQFVLDRRDLVSRAEVLREIIVLCKRRGWVPFVLKDLTDAIKALSLEEYVVSEVMTS